MNIRGITNMLALSGSANKSLTLAIRMIGRSEINDSSNGRLALVKLKEAKRLVVEAIELLKVLWE